MKSLGNTLIEAREENRVTLDQVVHETNISRHYLEALEAEDFRVFPAEAYLIGFLKNYAEYLGLDTEKILGLYNNYKINEQPAPIEQLVGLSKGRRTRRIIFFSILAFLLILAAGVWMGPRLGGLIMEKRAARQEEKEEIAEPLPQREIFINQPLWEGQVFPGDILVLPQEEGNRRIFVNVDDELLILEEPDEALGPWSLSLGGKIHIPSQEEENSWQFYLKDIGLPNSGVILEIQKNIPQEVDPEILVLEPAAPPSGELVRQKNTQVITSSPRRKPFTMEIVFRGFCLFRYRQGSQPPRDAYYAEGEVLRLDVNSSLTFSASDAGALSVKIAGKETPLGRRGEVTVGQVYWKHNDDAESYDLTLTPLY